MGRQCRHWNVGCMFPHCWQGCSIWHCSWLVGGLHPTLGGSTHMWAFQEGPQLRQRREMAATTVPKTKDNMAIRDGCVLNPQKGRNIQANTAPKQIILLGSLWILRLRLQSFPHPQNHVIFITKVLEMEGRKEKKNLYRRTATSTVFRWWPDWGNYDRIPSLILFLFFFF